jgi:hypothetical protein
MTGGLHANFSNRLDDYQHAPGTRPPGKPSRVDDHALLDLVQRQTARYFWEGAHPVNGLA